MARLNRHHIEYFPEEWTVEIQQSWHRCVSRLQNSKATPDLYMCTTNMMHSLTHEWNRLRKELQLGGDWRTVKPRKPFKRTAPTAKQLRRKKQK